LALWAIVAAVERFVRRDRRGRAAALVLDALSLLWLVAGALLLLGVHPWAKDDGSYLFTYPGILYPIACWAIALFAWTPRDWSWWLWFRNGATLIVYTALIVTLADWRLLGFS
jgi:hypothetical protein